MAVAQKTYAGIGARKLRQDMVPMLEALGRALALQGWVLRSGGAEGADEAFDAGAQLGRGAREIYLPWASFNGHQAKQDPAYVVPEHAYGPACWDRALALAAEHYPHGWRGLTQGEQRLMARNVFQVLGPDLASPATMLVCWAKGSVRNAQGDILDVNGGTGQAVRVAAHFNVPIYNLDLPEHRAKVEVFLAQAGLSVPPPAPRRLRR